MFLGMSFALPAHYLSEWYRHKKAETDPATAAGSSRRRTR